MSSVVKAKIQADFTQACAKLGQLEYQIKIMKDEAEALKEHIKDLNKKSAVLAEIEEASAEAQASEDSNG